MSSDPNSSIPIIGGSLGTVVLLIIIFSCCCCGNTKLQMPHHTLMCDAQNEAREKISRQNGCRPRDGDRNCICPPDQGVNKRREGQNIPPMPMTGHEIPLEGVTIGRNEHWDGRGMSPAQVNAYNGQASTAQSSAWNGQAVNARTEMGDRVEDAPPPYSEPAGGMEMRGPEAAVIRPIRVDQDPTGNAVVWREGDERQAAPEVSRYGGWSRWAG